MKLKFSSLLLLFINVLMYFPLSLSAQKEVPENIMKKIYNEVKTPYKYGLVLVPKDKNKMIDSPSVFRYKGLWYMSYIVFDGKGYETWLAQSNDLLSWRSLGRIMSFSENTWDSNQKAGYIALQDYTWGGSYKAQKYNGKYWMSYLGGSEKGYEAGRLGVGIASTRRLIGIKEWDRLEKPVLSALDSDVRWYDNQTIYKSTIIFDKKKTLGSPFVMYYNAHNKEGEIHAGAERIAMAVSDDMIHWKRYGNKPLIDHQKGISGDAFISRINNVWVMFYFGAFWKAGAFDRFACSYDLVNWTDWEGEDLIFPSEPYDDQYAHKPYVIKYNGTVYHFYCAVNKQGGRGIAVATSVDKGKSKLQFITD